MAVLLKTSGEQVPTIPPFGKFSIDDVLEMLHTPHVEVLKVWENGSRRHMVVVEDGFHKGKPFNPQASREARKAIYGDALVAKSEELGGA